MSIKNIHFFNTFCQCQLFFLVVFFDIEIFDIYICQLPRSTLAFVNFIGRHCHLQIVEKNIMKIVEKNVMKIVEKNVMKKKKKTDSF